MDKKTNLHVDSSREDIFWKLPYSATDSDVLRVEMAGITLPDKNYGIRRTRSSSRSFDNLYVIEYVVSGIGYIESEGIRMKVCTGDLYVIHRHTVHSYYADKQQPFCKKWVNVSGSFINAMEDVFFSNGPFTVLPLGERAEKIIDSIHETLKRASDYTPSVRADVMRALVELFLLMDEYKSSLSADFTEFERIIAYIDRHIYEAINVNTLSEKFFISPSTLYRTFLARTGLSPKAYITSKKIDIAKRMIAANDFSLNTIAAMLGFYDSHHFFKAFRSVTGQSPSEYRRAVLTEENI